MKKLSTLLYALIFLNPVCILSQQMQEVDSAHVFAQDIVNSWWLDIDNNSIHELILQSKVSNDSTILLSFNWESKQTDTLNNMVFDSSLIRIEDVDNSNSLDVIGFTRSIDNRIQLSVFYQNESTFESGFEVQYEDIQEFYIQDWNKDGLKDLLILQNTNDSLALSMLKNSSSGFDPEPELINTLAPHSKIHFLDISLNGRRDILITSNSTALPSVPTIIINHEDSLEVKKSKLPQASYESIGLGDYNHDGKIDFFASYKVNDHNSQLAVFVNQNSDFENSLPIDFEDFEPNTSFLADFNSDGLTDVFLSDSLNAVLIYQSIQSKIAVESIPQQENRIFNFYDEDLDGDLDVSSIVKNNSTNEGGTLALLDNKIEIENLPPSVPTFQTAFQTRSGVIISWNDAIDDHTSSKNITYDLFIGQDSYNTGVLAPNFDINTTERLKTQRGNNFYGNTLKLDSLSVGTYSYGIQPIDNSLTSKVIDGLCPPGCGGRYMSCGEFEICESLTETIINACVGNEIVLGDQENTRHWYSERRGFLGTSDSLVFVVDDEDIIYSRDAEFISCESYQMYKINSIHNNTNQLEDIVLCQADEIALNYEEEADSIKWFTASKGFLSDEFDTSVFIESNDIIRYEAYFNSCRIEGAFSVKFDESKVKIANNSIQIQRGGTVQLNAEGTLDYEWFPANSLSQNNISNPVASPEATTEYIVRGTSQLGCVSQDTVEVRVLQEAFIPDLFTPNGDARNDRLRIYGLVDVAEFEFVVYDREGNIVFKTDKPNRMATTGWDGTKAGSKAEAGIYFWQVRGVFNNGETIRLNGQEKGKVLLSK